MNQRFYVDDDTEYNEDFFVFDSCAEPHKAVSSWSCKQDADDDCARRNESAKELIAPKILADVPNKLTGMELIRCAQRLFDNGSETFADKFDAVQLLKIAQGWKACEWDIHPDKWEEQQISDLLVYDEIPQWIDESTPLYS